LKRIRWKEIESLQGEETRLGREREEGGEKRRAIKTAHSNNNGRRDSEERRKDGRGVKDDVGG